MKLLNKLNENKIFFFLYGLIFILYIVLLPQTAHGGDMWCWREWCCYGFKEGLSKIYNSGTDYVPLYHYMLWVFGHYQGSVTSIQNNIYYIKIITLTFDFIAGYFLIRIISKKYGDKYEIFTYSLFYFLNIFVLYNSIIWGQVDGIMACLVFISFYYAFRGKILLSLIFVVLAVNIKLQSVVFLPFIGLILLPQIIQHFSWKRLIQWIAVPLIIQVLILLPFIISGTMPKVLEVVLNSFNKYPVVSMNAYNFWSVFFKGGSLMGIPDSQKFIGITYKKIGLLLFLITFSIALYPLIKAVFQSIKSKLPSTITIEKLLITGALIPLLFFYFNTQMHERYSHPAFIFLLSYCILEKKPVIGLLASLAYFLNLEDVLHYFQLSHYGTVIFSHKFVSFLYLITIILLFNELFENRLLKLKKMHEMVSVFILKKNKN